MTKVIKIKGKDFTFDISDFTVNQYLSIEAEKQRISNGGYSSIATSMLLNSVNVANMIDMIATFRVLQPAIEDNVSTKDFSKLNLFDTKELLEAYMNDFLPWFGKWMKDFRIPLKNGQEGENDSGK